jgi:hypothetical protein
LVLCKKEINKDTKEKTKSQEIYLFKIKYESLREILFLKEGIIEAGIRMIPVKKSHIFVNTLKKEERELRRWSSLSSKKTEN